MMAFIRYMIIDTAPHILWPNSIDAQNFSSYTPAVKKQCLSALFRSTTRLGTLSFNCNFSIAPSCLRDIGRFLAIILLLVGLSSRNSAAESDSPVSIADQSGISPITIAPALPPNSVLLFSGQFTTDNMGNSLNPFTAHYESNFIVGRAYERDFYEAPYGFVFGVEIGVADRFGMGKSAELWGGVNVRNSGLVFFNFLRITPGITVGFSAITNPVGIEAKRQSIHNGKAYILGYLGPELALAFQQFPNLELVYRLQHRSGASGTFSNMWEGANANIIGVRYRF